MHLGGGVAEPHGVDITRDDEGRAVVQKLYGGLQGVGVALGKEQSQIVAAHLIESLANGIDLIAEEVGELIHEGYILFLESMGIRISHSIA